MFIRVHPWPNLPGATLNAPGEFSRIDSHQHFTREYLPSLLFPILKRNRFDGSVAVVNVPSVEETRWLLGLAAEHDFIRAVVGWADLADPRVGEVLDEYQRHAKFRGVCYWFEGDLPRGLGEVSRRGLTLDVSAGYTPAIADGFPALRVAIDHVGTRRGPDPSSAAQYGERLRENQRPDHRCAHQVEGGGTPAGGAGGAGWRSAPNA